MNDYLSFLREQSCLFTGAAAPSEPHHIRTSDTAGTGKKPADKFAIPLHWEIHRKCHNPGMATTIREMAPDWLLIRAMQAYAEKMHREWEDG